MADVWDVGGESIRMMKSYKRWKINRKQIQSLATAYPDAPSRKKNTILEFKFSITGSQVIPHLPGEGCLILSQLFSSSSASYPPPAPPAPPAPPPPASPPPPLPPLPRPLLPCQLFANIRAQCAPLDLNLGPSQLSGHRWTSTWDLPSSVGTAGPQPGTCPAQCAPLDLNLGPSQLSVHCWTSTWDLPSSVCTAGPQRPDRMPEDMPDRMSDRMPEDMPDKMP